MLGQKVPRGNYCGWKTLLGLSLLLAFAAFLTWPQAEEDPATNMAAVPLAARVPLAAQSTPSLRQLPMARQFMQPSRARQTVQPVAAMKSPTEPEVQYPSTQVESFSLPEEDGRRGMLSRSLAALALAGAAQEQPANAKEVEGRPLLLLTPLAAAVGWVLFNILGPAGDQFGIMADRKDELDGKPKKRR